VFPSVDRGKSEIDAGEAPHAAPEATAPNIVHPGGRPHAMPTEGVAAPHK
jgi:hypothetical protein